MKLPTEGRYDVVAVTLSAPPTVRVLSRDRDAYNAMAVIKLAIYQRGVENEFYTVAPLGKYQDGDEWGAPKYKGRLMVIDDDCAAGVEISPGVYFLGWDGLPRAKDAVECLKCGGYAEEVASTKEEIDGPLNCGQSYACCCAAFVCKKCGARMAGHREAPEMD